MRILVLVLQDEKFRPTNNFYIPNSLCNLGHEVILGEPNSLQLLRGSVVCQTCQFAGGSVGDAHPEMHKLISCEDFDLVWFLDYPHPELLIDYFRLLWVLSKRVPFVNDPVSVFLLNNKLGPLGLESCKYFPLSSVLNSSELIHQERISKPESAFVIKPPDKGCGADVFLISPHDPNAKALIESSLGNPSQLIEMYGSNAVGRPAQYLILQEYIEGLRERENRVLLAGGQIVGGYRKIAAPDDFRGNYLVGASLAPLAASESTRYLSTIVARELLTYGIHFLGLDVADDRAIEVNLVNPGGISGHLEATGENIGSLVCEAVIASRLGV